MIDIDEIIKTIEKIYKKTGLLECIKKQNAKQKNKLLIFPIIIFIILLFILLFLPFCKTFSSSLKLQIIHILLLFFYVISIFWILRNHKKFLLIQYGIAYNDDEKFYYNLFKKDILESNFSKEILIKVKDILEIETREEQNPLTTYFIGYCSLILIPTSYIIFEDYIKTHPIIFLYVILAAIVLPIFIYLIDFLLNAKHYNKKAILKNIERILIEIED